MGNPLVSVAIPFYNSEEYLLFSIQSVLNQSYACWELLLIDDGSSDNSLSIAQSYAAKDSRITVYSDGNNLGLAKRLNQSILLAKGKYYARMDADDIMLYSRLNKQVDLLESHPEIDVIGSSAMIIDNKNSIIKSSNMGNNTSDFIHPSIMGKLEWFQSHMYDGSYSRCQDKELWLRSAPISVFYNTSEPLIFYREFGLPSVDKLLVSYKIERRLYRNYKEYGYSLSWSIKNTLESLAKSFVYYIFGKCGLLDFVISLRRRTPVSENERLTKEDLERSIYPLI